MKLLLRTVLGLQVSALVAVAAVAHPGRYMEREAFLSSAFPGTAPQQATLWLSEPAREPLERALGQRFPVLRVQYWQSGSRTAWILDEIGKEEPITIGVVIDGGAVDMVRILEFRESRVSEVRYPFFTDQFSGARLRGAANVDKQIDSITGATLSVRAVSRVVQTSLLLHDLALHEAAHR
jgi:hypothetical protein